MATTPKTEPTEAEQYAAEEQARINAIEADKDKAAASTAAPSPAPKVDAKATTAKPKVAAKATTARTSKVTKTDARIEVYEQRGPKGLYKVTRNIDTGESTAELIDE